MRNSYNHPHGQTRCVTHATSCERRAGCEFMHHPRERDVKRWCEFMHRPRRMEWKIMRKDVVGGPKDRPTFTRYYSMNMNRLLHRLLFFTCVNLDIHCCSCTATNSFVLLNIVKLITVTPPSSITGNHCHLLANWHCTRPLLLQRARLAQHCTILSTRRNFWFRALDWDLFKNDQNLIIIKI